MADQYLGEMRIMAFGFAPKGWAQCNGQILPISQNQALFALLGTFYGGNGTTNFQLPNLQGRVAIGFGAQDVLGSAGGEMTHTLNVNEIPSHNHSLNANSGTANTANPLNATLATPNVNARLKTLYAASGANTANGNAVGNAGSNQAHNNAQPYNVLNVCIALTGIFPSRS